MPSSVTAARHAHNPSLAPRKSVRQEAIDKAWQTIQRDGVNAAPVRALRTDLGGNQRTFHDAILTLLEHAGQLPLPSQSRQALIEHVRSEYPDFGLNAAGKEGKTALDLAVQYDDLALAHYVLSKGAHPERRSTAASAEIRTKLTAWRRQNLLYAQFNAGNSQGLTGLDRQLQAGLHDQIRGLLDHDMAGRSAYQAWNAAMAIGRHDKALSGVQQESGHRQQGWLCVPATRIRQ